LALGFHVSVGASAEFGLGHLGSRSFQARPTGPAHPESPRAQP